MIYNLIHRQPATISAMPRSVKYSHGGREHRISIIPTIIMTIAIIVYILLGAVGVPVFVGFNAGLGALAGPTGGYIIGYLPSVIVFALLYRHDGKTTKSFILAIIRGLPAMTVCYVTGTFWFMFTTGVGLIESLIMCVIPFIPGDVLKIAAAVAICRALMKPLRSILGS